MRKSKSDVSQTTDPALTRRRWKRRTTIALAALLAYTLFGFFGVPLLIRHVVAPRISRSLNGTLTIDKARFNPFTFVLRLENTNIVDSGGQRVLGCDYFSSNFQLLDTIFSSGYHFKDTLVRRPFAHAELYPDGSNTFTRLIKPEPPSAKPSKPSTKSAAIPRVVMRLLDVAEGTVEFRDNTLADPYATQIDGIEFALKGLDTRPKPANPHSFVAHTSSGATVTWDGTFHLDPLTSTGEVKLTGLDLAQFGPYVHKFTPGSVTSGSLSIELGYDFAPAATPRIAKVNIHSLAVQKLGIVEPEGRLVDLTRFGVQDMAVDASARTVEVAAVTVDHPGLTIDRDEHGILNVVRLLPKNSDAATRTTPSTVAAASSPSTAAAVTSNAIDSNTDASADSNANSNEDRRIDQLRLAIAHLLENLAGQWAVTVQHVKIDSAAAAFTDHTTSPNVTIPVTNVSIVAGPIKSADGFTTPLKLQGSIGTRGTFDVQGVVKPLAQDADLAIKVADLDATLAAPYIPAQFDPSIPPARLSSTVVALDGRAKFSRDPSGDINANWSGETHLANISVEPIDSTNATALLGVASVHVKGDTAANLKSGTLALQWKGNVETKEIGSELPIAGRSTLNLSHAALDGQLDLAGSAMKFNGNAQAEGINAALPGINDAKLAVGSFNAKDIALDSSALTGSIAEVAIDAPSLAAALPLLPPPTAEGSGNAAKPAENPTPATAAPATTSPATVPPSQTTTPRPLVKIQHLRITNGSGDFVDPSAQPPLRLQADQFTFDAVGLSTDGQSSAQITTTARVQESGQMKIAGTVNPFAQPPSIDVKVEMAALPLKPYDAVTGRYVGYLVDQGRMSLTMPVAIQEGQLKGELDVNLDRFYLGDSFKSPDAPNVPVKLGLNLLRDSSEQITARVGFSGKLDDPSFSFGGIVWKAFFNLIVKAATSPFKVLGKLFGASDDQDLSRIVFDPGVADLNPKALAALDILAKGLRERPALKLSIVGRTSESDIPALKKIILRERLLKTAQRDDRSLTVLTDEAYRSLLDSEFGDTYGNDQKRRKNAEGKTERVPFEEMEAKLLADTDVTAERLAALAKARAEAVAGVLTKDNALPADRVMVNKETTKDPADQPRADLQMEK